MDTLRLHEFSPEKTNEIITFIEQHPWEPHWPEALLRRFLGNLVSNSQHVFDIWDGTERVAVAVLLDRIVNPSNHWSLEILGVQHEAEAKTFDFVIERALKLWNQRSDGLDIGFPSDFLFFKDLMNRWGFQPHYETYEMVSNELLTGSVQNSPVAADTEEYDEILYHLLRESFAENVEANITSLKDFKVARRGTQDGKVWIQYDGNLPVGFISLQQLYANVPEIRTLGVLKDARHRGWGKNLLQTAINYLVDHGVESCQLTVVTTNEKALGLYKAFGFKTIKNYKVFCRKK